MSTLYLVIGFYIFCALNIAFLLWVWRVLNRPATRSSDGDITTEVGYEEDSVGHVLSQVPLTEDLEAEKEEPHVAVTRQGFM